MDAEAVHFAIRGGHQAAVTLVDGDPGSRDYVEGESLAPASHA